MPGDPGAPVVTNARVYYHYTRGCGCNGHPAFPTPSKGRRILATTRTHRAAGSQICVNRAFGQRTATDIRRRRGYINPPGTSGLLAFELESEHDGIYTIERRPRRPPPAALVLLPG